MGGPGRRCAHYRCRGLAGSRAEFANEARRRRPSKEGKAGSPWRASSVILRDPLVIPQSFGMRASMSSFAFSAL